MARLRLLAYRWPRHVRIFTIVVTLLGAALLVTLAVLVTNQGPMCGEVVMTPNDECFIGNSGTPASYSDVANSPLPAILFAAAVGLVGWLVIHLHRNRKPTGYDIAKFDLYVRIRRSELREIYQSSPDCQATWSSPEELLALFDEKVERERKRKGIATAKT
ncbi:MAG TPA: hypothetical protein VJ914_03415 [Pseudonocardiaceae bacterium]|nr:hypothetical protein [Pseudonocardiaceae bacterium]